MTPLDLAPYFVVFVVFVVALRRQVILNTFHPPGCETSHGLLAVHCACVLLRHCGPFLAPPEVPVMWWLRWPWDLFCSQEASAPG